jgi:hypothetical protein
MFGCGDDDETVAPLQSLREALSRLSPLTGVLPTMPSVLQKPEADPAQPVWVFR